MRLRKVFIIPCAALAAIVLGGCHPGCGVGAERNRTQAFHRAIRAGLENYRSENGEYPAPAQPSVRTVIDGHDFEISGALTLYQALSGDGNDKVKTALTPRPSNGKIDNEELRSVFIKNMPEELILKTDAGWILVDGWRHPFQYATGTADCINTSYDLWSFAEQAPPPAVTLEDKKVRAEKDRWITN